MGYRMGEEKFFRKEKSGSMDEISVKSTENITFAFHG